MYLLYRSVKNFVGISLKMTTFRSHVVKKQAKAYSSYTISFPHSMHSYSTLLCVSQTSNIIVCDSQGLSLEFQCDWQMEVHLMKEELRSSSRTGSVECVLTPMCHSKTYPFKSLQHELPTREHLASNLCHGGMILLSKNISYLTISLFR